jgi:hypothetical protein
MTSDEGGISRRKMLGRIAAGTAVAWTAPAILTVGAQAMAGSPAPCSPGFANCDGSGCNCRTSTTAPGCCSGSTASVTGTCQTVHSNGIFQNGAFENYFDCVPAGTYNLTQATEACTAYTGSAALCTFSSCGGSLNTVCGPGPQGCACWQFSGTNTGHVVASGSSSCFCPGPGDPGWD